MIETVFRSEDVPSAERFARWHEMSNRKHAPVMIRSDHKADFQATTRNLDLGAVQVTELTFPPVYVSRPPKLIRQSDPETFAVWLGLRGTMEIAQGGRCVELARDELVLYDSSRPYHGRADAVTGVEVEFFRALMPIPSNAIARITAIRIPAGEGIPALFHRHLIELIRQAPRFRPADTARLATITLDLMAAMCASLIEADNCLPPETRQRALQAQIHDFVLRNLGDPDLSADTIAAAHQISVSYLYKLFEQQGLTVAGWIRQRRLGRCRRDLADPQLSQVPIHAIATRWGFTNNAHFSRLFRAAYGMCPKDYRAIRTPSKGVSPQRLADDSPGQA
ncbi:helix-turn-helix domain-containing protein [Actinomadura sp. DC4]|uniref:AraC-like ligand-binding domain-containing protein n=1 Tax=Actinomadura sp. DC4 TaxID=3055069 RepID=UPI0025AFCCE4|nr:helix-turn-helix domain-containing protein [Actinomadura sp. DC4]MDN3352775.1 helix-turn-helix domain-containing protein [Actinomadura sp. DC4]